MREYSTNQAAKKLGISGAALSKYIKAGKVQRPKVIQTAGRGVHAWTEEEIETLRALLPKIANGRKARHHKLKEQQPRAAALPKKRGTKKKK